jgi:hypothetical protein
MGSTTIGNREGAARYESGSRTLEKAALCTCPRAVPAWPARQTCASLDAARKYEALADASIFQHLGWQERKRYQQACEEIAAIHRDNAAGCPAGRAGLGLDP